MHELRYVAVLLVAAACAPSDQQSEPTQGGVASAPRLSEMVNTDRLDPAIAAFMTSAPDNTMQVLVVVDTPQPDLSSMIGRSVENPDARPKLPDAQERKAAVATVKRALTDLGVEDDVWHSNAQTFVVTLNPDGVKA
ncbi:MAG: hypothetical protein AAGJ87_08900, partial [Pseudomonadota bacterium]